MNIAIITGASSGIGEELLKVLVREHGAYGSVPFEQIWIIARNKDKLEALKASLDSDRIRVFSLDLTDSGSVEQIASALEKDKPGIGMLINCAGTGYIGLTENQPLSSMQSVVSLNCNAAADMISVCLPYMISTGDKCDYKNGPRILNIASSAGFFPQPGFAAYAATKSFLISLSRALHVELRHHNIASTTVCPGPVATDFIARASGKEKADFRGIRKLFVVRADKLAEKSIAASRKGRGFLVYGVAQKALHIISKFLPTRFMMFLSAKTNGIPRKRTPQSDDQTNKKIAPENSSLSSDISTTVLLPISSGKASKRTVKNEASSKVSSMETSVTLTESIAKSPPADGKIISPQKKSSTGQAALSDVNMDDMTSDAAAKILSQYPGRDT